MVLEEYRPTQENRNYGDITIIARAFSRIASQIFPSSWDVAEQTNGPHYYVRYFISFSYWDHYFIDVREKDNIPYLYVFGSNPLCLNVFSLDEFRKAIWFIRKEHFLFIVRQIFEKKE